MAKQDPEMLAIARIRAILKKLPSPAAQMTVLQYVTHRVFQVQEEETAARKNAEMEGYARGMGRHRSESEPSEQGGVPVLGAPPVAGRIFGG